LIEDKWNRTKTKAVEVDKDDMELNIKLDVDENGIPWWAKMLDQKKFKSRSKEIQVITVSILDEVIF
jgi:hypothetical protein